MYMILIIWEILIGGFLLISLIVLKIKSFEFLHYLTQLKAQTVCKENMSLKICYNNTKICYNPGSCISKNNFVLSTSKVILCFYLKSYNSSNIELKNPDQKKKNSNVDKYCRKNCRKSEEKEDKVMKKIWKTVTKQM